MNHHKLLYLTIILLLSFGAVTAQNQTGKKQEFSVYAKGIFNSLGYDLSGDARHNNGYGAGGGLEYSLYLNTQWSVSAGIEYQQYRSESLLSGFNDFYLATDAEGSDFDFHSSANTYKEQQWVDMINIPILFRYETPTPWTSASVYGAVGFQIGIPAISKYKATATGLNTSGYFKEWDVILDGPEFMGFGSWGTVESNRQKLDIRNNYSLLFELGFKQPLNKTRNLYLGFYADMGLNRLTNNSGSPSPLIGYDTDNPTQFEFNPLFYSAPKAQGENYASKPKIRAAGIKIRYALKF